MARFDGVSTECHANEGEDVLNLTLHGEGDLRMFAREYDTFNRMLKFE
jgi:hypothetical protein